MQADIAGNGVVDAGGSGETIDPVLATAHGDNVVGAIKEGDAVNFFTCSDVTGDHRKVNALVVEQIASGSFGQSVRKR